MQFHRVLSKTPGLISRYKTATALCHTLVYITLIADENASTENQYKRVRGCLCTRKNALNAMLHTLSSPITAPIGGQRRYFSRQVFFYETKSPWQSMYIKALHENTNKSARPLRRQISRFIRSKKTPAGARTSRQSLTRECERPFNEQQDKRALAHLFFTASHRGGVYADALSVKRQHHALVSYTLSISRSLKNVTSFIRFSQ